MRTAEIKVTGRRHGSIGLTREINYIGDDSTQAHDLKELPKKMRSQKIYQKRNIDIGGIGVFTDIGKKRTIHDFKLLAKKRPNVKVKTLDLVISPQKGTVNPKNIEQVHQFMNFCKRYIRKAFPNHYAYIAIQFDNFHRDSDGKLLGGIPHAHLIISNLSSRAPYKALSSKSYGIYHLRRVYDQQRIIFNHRQNTIHLGAPALLNDNKNDRFMKPIINISNNAQDIINDLEKGKYTNKTQLKKAFKNKDIIIQFHDFKHRKYHIITDNNGKKRKKYIYRKYQTGPKKGQYMWRKSKHGRHKVPVYTHSHGITLHYAKKTGQRQRHYVKGSDILDNRFNYRHIMHCLNHASELRKKYELEDETKWKVKQAIRKWGPESSLDSGSSASINPLSVSYSYSYSSAVSTISKGGTDLSSITPRPLSSVSYNPVTERALASLGDTANPFSATLDSFSSIEDTFSEANGAVASGATTENGLDEKYNVNTFMPKISSSEAQQGAFTKVNEVYPEYLVSPKDGKQADEQTTKSFHMTDKDNSILNGLFNNIKSVAAKATRNAEQRLIRIHDILKKKANAMKTWLSKHQLPALSLRSKIMPNKREWNFFKTIPSRFSTIAEPFHIAWHTATLKDKFDVKIGTYKRNRIRRNNPKKYDKMAKDLVHKYGYLTTDVPKSVRQKYPDLIKYKEDKDDKEAKETSIKANSVTLGSLLHKPSNSPSSGGGIGDNLS